jgi:uncharacterized alpha-E superfamily protein
MLSRVATRIYWMGRYLERAENMARLVNVNAHLLLDLPLRVQVGWRPLVEILGSEALFEKTHDEYDERSVVRFLVGDPQYSSSILSALAGARENARTVRDIIPREGWEQINELYLNSKKNLPSAYGQRKRYDYLNSVILGNQQITGLLAGTMSHDTGYAFLRLGRNLERADMTTRIIDVRSADLLPGEGELSPFDNIQWMSVLKSLTAYQMYRREVRLQVRRPDVINFLFRNLQFPRAIYHCISTVAGCLGELPHNDALLRQASQLQRMISDVQPEALDQQGLHQIIDDLQLGIAEVDRQIAGSYFLVGTESNTDLQAARS